MREVYGWIDRLGRLDVRVLILGETGTGKELVARALHAASSRRDRPFVAVNCAAIPETLVEAELFGTLTGAFTGAASRSSRFEQAHGGSLFLDEVGELRTGAQAALLRALEEGVIHRVGAGRRVPVDVRILSATNRELASEAATGLFRRDLFFRLREATITLPPLRDRGDDLRLLTDHALTLASTRFGVLPPSVSEATRQMLAEYDWPGNVRELEDVVKQAVLAAAAGLIEPRHLPEAIRQPRSSVTPPVPRRPAGLSLPDAVAALAASAERAWIEQELRRHRRLSDAAAALGIHRRTLYEKCERYGLRSTLPDQ